MIDLDQMVLYVGWHRRHERSLGQDRGGTDKTDAVLRIGCHSGAVSPAVLFCFWFVGAGGLGWEGRSSMTLSPDQMAWCTELLVLYSYASTPSNSTPTPTPGTTDPIQCNLVFCWERCRSQARLCWPHRWLRARRCLCPVDGTICTKAGATTPRFAVASKRVRLVTLLLLLQGTRRRRRRSTSAKITNATHPSAHSPTAVALALRLLETST